MAKAVSKVEIKQLESIIGRIEALQLRLSMKKDERYSYQLDRVTDLMQSGKSDLLAALREAA